MGRFNIKKMENLLEERAKMGFSGWTICISEAEMREIIKELKQVRTGAS